MSLAFRGKPGMSLIKVHSFALNLLPWMIKENLNSIESDHNDVYQKELHVMKETVWWYAIMLLTHLIDDSLTT